MKCIICGTETGSSQDTCSGKCFREAIQLEELTSETVEHMNELEGKDE